MILDKNLDSNIRFSKNMAYYNSEVRNLDNKELIIKSFDILDSILDQILEVKLKKSAVLGSSIPKVPYLSKIDLCYQMKFIQSNLRETLRVFQDLVNNFSSKDSLNSFAELSVQTNILKLCKKNDNELFTLILNLISSDMKIKNNYTKVDDLINDIGWSGVFKFVCSIIQASLIEALVKIK